MGEPDVDALLAGVSSRLLGEWMAYAAIEPWGEERADLRAGIVASVIANANRDPKRQRRAFTPRDFMPRFEERPERPTAEQVRVKWAMIVEAYR